MGEVGEAPLKPSPLLRGIFTGRGLGNRTSALGSDPRWVRLTLFLSEILEETFFISQMREEGRGIRGYHLLPTSGKSTLPQQMEVGRGSPGGQRPETGKRPETDLILGKKY